MNRKEILETVETMVNGNRQDDYGTPEQNFEKIAMLWTHYLGAERLTRSITPVDVAAMMALLKIARVASGHGKSDNWVDLAGYAACGGELQSVLASEGATREDAESTDADPMKIDWTEVRKTIYTGINAMAKVLKTVKIAEDSEE